MTKAKRDRKSRKLMITEVSACRLVFTTRLRKMGEGWLAESCSKALVRAFFRLISLCTPLLLTRK